jgi:hypothetical protein
MFQIDTDPRRKLLRVRLAGFFTIEEVADFCAQAQAAIIGMGCGSGEHMLLVDTRECVLQAQPVVTAFGKLISEPRFAARRIAIVTGTVASRMQTRRILAHPDAKLFDTPEQADAWLAGEAERAAAA